MSDDQDQNGKAKDSEKAGSSAPAEESGNGKGGRSGKSGTTGLKAGSSSRSGTRSLLPPSAVLGRKRPSTLGLASEDDETQILTESSIIETDIDLPKPPPPPKSDPVKGDTLKGFAAVPTKGEPSRAGFVKLPTNVRQNMADDIGLEHDLELDEALADFTAQYDGELAAIGPGESQRAARLHLAIGRMLELSGYDAAAQRRYAAAMARNAGSVVAIRELRRMARAAGKWQEVLQLLNAEAEVVTDATRRAAILEERGRLLRKFSGAEASLEAFEQVVQLQPDSVSAREAQRAIFASEGNWEAVARALLEAANLTSDTMREMAYRLLAAEITEHRLKRSEEASDLYVKAMSLVPSHQTAMSGAERLLLRQERYNELYKHMLRQGQALKNPSEVYGLYVRAGMIAADRLHDTDAAVHCFESAHTLFPDDVLPLRLLVDLYRGNQQAWEKLDETYVRVLGRTSDPGERAALTMARVDNLLEHVHPADTAIEALSGLLDEQPGFAAGLDKLRPLLIDANRHREYIDRAWQVAERTPSGTAQVARFVDLGHFCEQTAQSAADALNCYKRALSISPTSPDAFQGLERLYLAANDYGSLADLYEQTCDAIEDEHRRAGLLWSLAMVYDHRLGEPEKALAAIEKYRKIRPNDLSAIWMVQRIHGQQEDWTELIDALEVELALSEGPELQASLHYRIGMLYEQSLEDIEAALKSYRASIASMGAYLPSHQALTRVLADEGQWTAMVKALEQRLNVEPASGKATILYQVGRIHETQLGDRSAAIRAYERTLALDPDYVPAQAGLERIHRSNADWGALRESLQRSIRDDMPPTRRASTLTRIGTVLGERLDEYDEAEKSLQAALEANPTYPVARQELEAIYGKFEKWGQLADLMREALVHEEDVSTRAQLAYRYASLITWRLRKSDEAIQPMELALALEPELPGVREALEMLYRELEQLNDAAELLYEQARNTEDVDASIALFKESADITAFELDGDQTRALNRILQHNALDYTAIERLEPLAERRTDLADLWQRRLNQPQGDEATELRLSLAEVVGGSDSSSAYTLLTEAVSLTEDHLPALRMAANAAVAAGEFEAACNLREAEAEAVRDVRTRVASLMAAGRIARDQLNQQARARETFEQALDLCPDRADIFKALAELLQQQKDWAGLANMLRQHIDALSAGHRLDRLAELAALQRDRLQDKDAAVKTLHELLQIEPGHVVALSALARLETELRHWNEAVDAFRRALATGEATGDVAREWRLSMARILVDQLADADAAEPVLQEMLSTQPGDTDALRMLGRLYQSNGRMEDAAQILDTLAASCAPAEAAEVHVRLAKIRTALEQEDRAREHLAQASQLIQKDIAALTPLLEWAERTGELNTVVELLEEVLLSAPAALSEAMVPVRLALARLLADLDRRGDAEREARMAAHTDPANVHAQLLAAQLQVERNEARKFAMAAIAVDPFNAEAYGILAEGFEQAQLADAVGRCHQVLVVLGDTRPAIVQAANSVTVAPPDPGAALGDDGLIRLIAHENLPEWGRELLARAGHKAQIFMLPELPKYALQNDNPLYGASQEVAEMLGFSDFEINLTSAQNISIAYDGEKPSRILFGPLAQPQSLAEARYHVAHAVVPVMLGMTLLAMLDDRDFLRLLQGLIGLGHDGYGEPDVVKQISRFLPRRSRKSVIEYVRNFDPRSLRLDLGEWRRALSLTSRRAGLLAARDVRASVSGLLRTQNFGAIIDSGPEETVAALSEIPDSGDLLRFCVEDNYARARRMLGMSADSVARDGQ